MTRTTTLSIFCFLLILAFAVQDAFGHGGSFRGPNSGIPPGLRTPSDAVPPPPPPTDPGDPGGPTTPDGPDIPGDETHTPTDGSAPPPPPTQPGGKRGPKTTPMTMDSWRFWWAYNNDDILNLKSHLYGNKLSSASPLFFASGADKNNVRDVQLPTRRAVVTRIIPALKRSLDRPRDHEDIHGGALVALGKVGTVDFVGRFEEAARNRLKTGKGVSLKLGQQATESAVLALGMLPKLDETSKAEVRSALLGILDDKSLRSRERAWAAVGLGLQRDEGAVTELLERLGRDYDGEAKRNVPAGILCGLGLIGSERSREALEEAFAKGRFDGNDLDDRVRAYFGYALGKTADARSLDTLLRVVKSRRAGRLVKRSAVIAVGTCGANADADGQAAAIKALKRYLDRSAGDRTGENFAIIALSRIGTDEALRELVRLAHRGRSMQRSYVALGLGTRVWYRAQQKSPVEEGLLKKIRTTLATLSEKHKDTETRAAFLLARGLVKDVTAVDTCVRIVSSRGDPRLRGPSCVALGLIGKATPDVKDALHLALRERKSKDLRRDAATALGLLRDADTVSTLLAELKNAKSFSVQAQIILAIGTIGDAKAIDPLIDLLDNTNQPEGTRAMAAVGLGMIGDLLPVPKLARLSKDYNYRATVRDIDELLYIL
ncbi:MAG: HEAT repeat domain-containing protein [Planctomycetota bacterium]|jgi:HEAT repeat protein